MWVLTLFIFILFFFNPYLSHMYFIFLFSCNLMKRMIFNYPFSFYYAFLIHVRIRTGDKE
ncbi:hypothetical protein CHD70_21810 [Salmonella enterica]|nr:hypothetical protein CHD70_21810 [Salmonella enterica]